MDLASQKEKRESRMNAKKEAIRSQNESVATSEAEAVAEAETSEDKK